MTLDVWTYWEGPMPEYISVCLRSVARVCGEPGVTFRLLTPENLHDFLPPGTLHPAYLALESPALRTDCVRAAVLSKHGGWWWDADTVGLRSPAALMEKRLGATAMYMKWTKPPARVLNGYVYLSPGSPAGKEWLSQINWALDSDPKKVSWLTLGEKVITPLLLAQVGAVEVDRRLFLPIDIDYKVSRFFDSRDFRTYLTNDAVCYGLNHSWFWYHRRREMEMPASEWPKSGLLIHRLLTHAARQLLPKLTTPEAKIPSVVKVVRRVPARTAVVTLAVGRGYWEGARVLFRSLEKHGMPGSVRRVVMSDDPVDPPFADRVSICRDYSLVKTKEGQFSCTAAKLFALALNFDRVIVIDSDILCVQDPSFLWSDRLGSLPFYAARDTASQIYYPREIAEIGLDKDRIINAGTLVYHRDAMPDLHDRLLESIERGQCRSYDGGDQGYFNHFLQAAGVEVGFLPNGYNYCLDPNMPQLPKHARFLIHFTGCGIKPWELTAVPTDGRGPYVRMWKDLQEEMGPWTP